MQAGGAANQRAAAIPMDDVHPAIDLRGETGFRSQASVDDPGYAVRKEADPQGAIGVFEERRYSRGLRAAVDREGLEAAVTQPGQTAEAAADRDVTGAILQDGIDEIRLDAPRCRCISITCNRPRTRPLLFVPIHSVPSRSSTTVGENVRRSPGSIVETPSFHRKACPALLLVQSAPRWSW